MCITSQRYNISTPNHTQYFLPKIREYLKIFLEIHLMLDSFKHLKHLKTKYFVLTLIFDKTIWIVVCGAEMEHSHICFILANQRLQKC